MGSVGDNNGVQDECKQSLTRGKLKSSSSSSFRLRSPSLNSIRLRRIFDVFDRNHDSLISVDELSQAVNLLGLDADQSEIESMVRSYIKSGNNGLRFEDFEALHRSLDDVFFGSKYEDKIGLDQDPDQDEVDLKDAFNVFDENGDGFISAKELQAVLEKLGLPEGNEIDRVEMMISSVDKDHDGQVDFVEFKDMMRTVIVPSS
ncbi:calcium-binding protein CAST-like [Nicotiana tabacum]|uniref:Calcium-binding protein CAST-like n=2 Tax=Nicotiana TaxID=4085 RepID=A0A1S4CMY8_TOBAC|nr:PREDICTED: calcium-binding protein CAST-like [Nicotiana sylvestris]XP_016502416.1 PREDICTED: calcium-binding protein CAST-like [Nicotiana tabacum]